ncbi:unnamed protein product [Tetraodon nigroviridis]|uniref:(spotted green pufferfish) hypothetical protein n=1 Tax=Tetraodon nigroviridis TaxID=99883 RepID=Q4RMF5_TETNG|nr:unnamed protein product [Tetraodon nigroviridis]
MTPSSRHTNAGLDAAPEWKAEKEMVGAEICWDSSTTPTGMAAAALHCKSIVGTSDLWIWSFCKNITFLTR